MIFRNLAYTYLLAISGDKRLLQFVLRYTDPSMHLQVPRPSQSGQLNAQWADLGDTGSSF